MNEAYILVDFSENYVCKYSKEVQSVHFGASKAQISLHTGVLYYHASNVSEVGDQNQSGIDLSLNFKCVSFCSISDNLRHDPSGIWAHLAPILKHIKDKLETVDTIHFQSDGPTTQYRNKKHFYLFMHFMKMHGFKHASWNFSEAGHGKGPTDGVGAVIKRTADRTVAHGRDIANFTMLMTELRKANLNVELYEIRQSEIEEIDKIVSVGGELRPLPKTMQLHQVVWCDDAPTELALRELSCCSCRIKKDCHHFNNSSAIFKFSSGI